MKINQIAALKKNPAQLVKILSITDDDKAAVEFCEGGTRAVIDLCELLETDRVQTEKRPFNGAVSVLGAIYMIVIVPEDDMRVENMDGYCDTSARRIVLRDLKQSLDSLTDLSYYQRKVLRHEIIHAFLYESGLDVNAVEPETGWAKNEEMVDWMAIQFPKIQEAFKEAGCEE